MNRRIGAMGGAIAVLVVLALGISSASAASLTLITRKLGAFTAGPCTMGPLGVTYQTATRNGYYSQVRITTSLPIACANLPIKLMSYDASSVMVRESAVGATTVTGAAFNVTMTSPYPATAVSGVALTIGGWSISTTWTGPAPTAATCVVTGVFLSGVSGEVTLPTTETCTVTQAIWNNKSGTSPHRYAGLQIDVTNNSTQIILWRLSTHLELFRSSANVALGWSPKDLDSQVTLVGQPVSKCSAMPAASLTGLQSNYPYSQIIYGGGTATMTFIAYESTADGSTC